MQEINAFTVNESYAGKRIDLFLSSETGDLSRSAVKKMIEKGMVTVNGQNVRPSYKLRPGDMVEWEEYELESSEVEAQNIPLEICYEDEDIAVINKPRGMVVHPAPGNRDSTLVNALVYRYPFLALNSEEMRWGIVHRLDKDTSGLLVVAKNIQSYEGLVVQLKERRIIRRYLALVHGSIKSSRGKISAPIGRHPVDRKKMAVVDYNSKEALTTYKVLAQNDNYSLLDLKLQTGRTHQIRVHMAYINHPVVGDMVYGYKRPHFNLEGQFLHAYKLGLNHPVNNEYIECTVPLPGILRKVLKEAGLEVPGESSL